MTPKQISTHSGSFHADESLAVYMLRLLPEYKDAKLVRSRNPEDWEQSDIVVDVSAKYDGIKYFDHHQREFMETFSDDYNIKLSSAGLIYKHFGKRIIKSIISKGNDTNDEISGDVINEEDLEVIYQKVYKQFIESLDANDNGINKYDLQEGETVKFNDNAITIPGIISTMNPLWNSTDTSPSAFDQAFEKASKFIGEIFVNLVNNYFNSWLPAKNIVVEAIKKRMEVDPSGKIIVLSQFCPWKEHLYNVESDEDIENTIEFVIFIDSSGSWRVSTVPVTSTSFKFRKGLPEELRGLRDEELSEKSGVPDCIFIHAAGFIGGAKSKESALKLAKMSL
ncbi:Myg1p PWA37_004906 [Arxiozyma heterogenica]|uniref:Myg1p n=1 Tax=Arxiozyma heterogenica TaxID=278026 RepID=UPI002EDDB1EF